jgi:hypothetical protein
MTVREAVNRADNLHLRSAPGGDADSVIVTAADKAAIDHGRCLFDLLRQKWKEVPAGISDRVDTTKVLALSDWELRDYWEAVWHETSMGAGYATRGWYQEMYREMFRGKRVLEIGSGCGVDGIHFIQHGAQWYFADIVPSNLQLIRRLLDAFKLDCEGITYIEDLSCLDQIPGGFDFIYCNGSMIHVPFAFARRETLLLASHLRPGGRWVELCYPRERWAREGRLSFADWGRLTDGEATPWAEWYDLERLSERFAPITVKPVMAFNYNDDDFDWFDLRIDAAPDRQQVDRFLAATPPKRLPIGLSPAAFRRHDDSRVEQLDTPSGPALRVETAPALWSYAVHGTLSAATLHHAISDPSAELPAVELGISVQQGRIGLGVMPGDLGQFIGPERHLPKRPEPYVVRLACPPGQQRYHLLLRNTQGGNERSIATIHSMVLTSVVRDQSSQDGVSAPVIALTGLIRRHVPGFAPEGGVPVFARAVDRDHLHVSLGFAEPLQGDDRDMADAELLQSVCRHHMSQRHLQLGGNPPELPQVWTAETADGIAPSFFDSVLIDAVNRCDTLYDDTDTALPLLRSGGLMLWHGFCPTDTAMADDPAARHVVQQVHQGWRRWSPQFTQLFWVRHSRILVGIKR